MISVTPLATVTSPLLGWILLMLAAATVLGPHLIKAPPRWLWWLLVGGALLAFRWPLLWAPHQFNPDESQLISGALTLRYDPVFWRSVDGGNAGPLNFYPLLPAAWADGFSSYVIARLIGLATIFGTILIAGETLALVFGASVARLAVLPALAFHALTVSPDFTYFSTELIPAFLLALASWLAVRPSPTPIRLWFVAFLLGAAPWAKPQILPLAFVIWLLATFDAARSAPRSSLLPLLVGPLLPALAFFGLAASTGQLEHLVTPFFLQSLNYAQTNAAFLSWPETIKLQWQNAFIDGYLGLWIAGALAFAPLALARVHKASPQLRRATAATAFLLAAGLLSALAPRLPSLHYLHFLTLPLIWATGTALALALCGIRRTRLVTGLFLLCTLLPLFAQRLQHPDPLAAYRRTAPEPAQLRLTQLIRQLSSPGEPIAIWGWRSSLYVESARPQATRQAHSSAQIFPGPLQRYFLRRYFEDFQHSNPPVFIDAVGPGNFVFEDPNRAHESFPPLRTAIAARYTYVITVGGARVYARNDRLPRLDPAAAP